MMKVTLLFFQTQSSDSEKESQTLSFLACDSGQIVAKIFGGEVSDFPCLCPKERRQREGKDKGIVNYKVLSLKNRTCLLVFLTCNNRW